MKLDQDRGRYSNGYDAGQIVDGVVTFDPVTNRYILVDEDGIGYDPHLVLQDLVGRPVRLTLISLQALQELQNMLETAYDKASS